MIQHEILSFQVEISNLLELFSYVQILIFRCMNLYSLLKINEQFPVINLYKHPAF
jgi:hypothetical protein